MMRDQGTPKKGRTLRLSLIALVVLIGGMVIHIRTYDVITPSAQALLNQNELYIFVEQNKVAWSQNVWAFSWSAIRRALGIQTAPTFHRIDCVVYRITSSSLEKHQAKGWHVAGAVAPYKGVPHAFIGGGRDAGIYRWTGSDFVKLSPSEDVAARSGFTYTDELFKRERWSEMHVLPVRGSADYKFTLGGVPFVMRSTQTADGTSKIELIKGSDHESVQNIYEFKNKVVLLNGAEYKSLVE